MTNETAPVNRLILGDNLEIMKTLESESIDLIYLDPPFFSNRNYEVIWGDEGEIRSFKDRWAGGIDHYIMWLQERVELMHRLLKKTGSIFLHCDWHANAYIRVHILDRIFGEKNFRNGIAWCYYSPTSPHIKQLPRKHDTIFWYSKGNKWMFNKDNARAPFKDEKQTLRKRWGDDLSEEKIKEYREKGKVIEDFWTDIIQIGRSKAEIIGYPTQKPEALMERIIKIASNEGDVVLDPFMGGGTTIAVAERLGRRWIGIDQSVMAVKVTEQRLHKQNGHFEVIMTQSNVEKISA